MRAQLTRDPSAQVAIREAASGALAGCLVIAMQRDSQYRNDMFTMVLEQAQRGLKLNTHEAIHGSLLGFKELFLQSKTVRSASRWLSKRTH